MRPTSGQTALLLCLGVAACALYAAAQDRQFGGHDHLFAKQDLESIVYQEVPQSGE